MKAKMVPVKWIVLTMIGMTALWSNFEVYERSLAETISIQKDEGLRATDNEFSMGIQFPAITSEGPVSDDILPTLVSTLETEKLPPGEVPLPFVLKRESADPKNKTLVVLLGDLRGGEGTWNSLYENLLDINEADLALFTQAPPQAEYTNSSLLKRARYIEILPRYDDWADAIDLIDGPAWRESVLSLYKPEQHPIMLGGVKGFKSSAAVVFMFRYFAGLRIQQEEWFKQYDQFVITRTDHYYKCQTDLSQFFSPHIWVPKREDYGGICDRFYVAPPDAVVDSLLLVPPFLKKPRLFVDVEDGWMNPERFLKKMWEEAGIFDRVKRFRRTMFTGKTKRDTTAWSKGKDWVPEGVQLKYPKEYAESTLTCDKFVNIPGEGEDGNRRFPLLLSPDRGLHLERVDAAKAQAKRSQ